MTTSQAVQPQPQPQTNPFAGFLQNIGNFFQQDVNRAATSPNPLVALPARVAQNPGQFVQNVAAGTGNLIKEAVGMPGAIFNSIKNGTEPQDLQNLATNSIGSYKNIASDPYGSFIKDPVNTSLALAPAGKVLDTFGGGEAATAGNAANTEAPVPRSAVQSFAKQFTVPTKRAGMNDLNVMKTSEQILQHAKSNPSLLDDLPNLPGKVTGENGIISQMTRQAAGGINTEIPLGEPLKAATSILDGNKVLISPSMRDSVVNDINRTNPVSGTIGTMNAQDALDYARQLETKAAQFGRSSTYLTPRPEMEVLSKAYNAAADSIKEQIDKASQGVNIEGVKTPENMATLNQISPLLAKQVAQAKNVSELRSTAAPFVRLGKMQDLTENSANSTFGKVANGMSKFTKPLTIAGGTVAGVPGAIAGSMADEALEPAYSAALNKIKAPIQNAATRTMLNGGGSLPIGGMVKGAGMTTTAAVANNVLNKGNGNSEQINNQDLHNGNNQGQSVSQSYLDVKPDPTTGHFSVDTQPQPNPVYMTNADRLAQEKAISPYDPGYSNKVDQIEKQYQAGQEQAKNALSGEKLTFMSPSGAPQLVALGNQIADSLKDPNFLSIINNLKTPAAIKEYMSNPQNPYSQQVADLSAMNVGFTGAVRMITGERLNPGDAQLIQPGMSKEQLLEKLNRMQQFVVGSYNENLAPYLALTSPTGANNSQGQPVPANIPQSQPATRSSDASSIVGGTPPGLQFPPSQ